MRKLRRRRKFWGFWESKWGILGVLGAKFTVCFPMKIREANFGGKIWEANFGSWRKKTIDVTAAQIIIMLV